MPTAQIKQESRRRFRQRLASFLILSTVVLGWWMFLRPSSMGGPFTVITVTGESMEPGLFTDDIAIMYDHGSYEIGDVVAFRSDRPDGTGPGAYVIHRIKGGNGTDGYVMRGDNNDWDDPWNPTSNEIAGEMLLSIPNVGAGMRWISQPFHLASLMGSVVVAMVAAGGRPKTSASSAEEMPEVTNEAMSAR